jgi:putative mRNA 3-end processing factor
MIVNHGQNGADVEVRKIHSVGNTVFRGAGRFSSKATILVWIMKDILESTSHGLYCVPGDFHIDPHLPVARAVVTHAHSDHARWGCQRYLAAQPCEQLLRLRMSPDAEFRFLPYGETLTLGGVQVSFHPAGHILGSAQVRLEYQGQVVLITGDYKLGTDPTCEAWQPIRCHWMISESTFGLPIYRWPSQKSVFESINHWWRECRDQGKCCLLYAYAVGKSQRLLAGLDPTIGKIYCHGAVEKGNEAYRRAGITLPETTHVSSVTGKNEWQGSMIVAVPSAHGTPWVKKFGRCSTAMASGWMAVRGVRRRRSVDRGFVLSDHVDWPSLLTAIDECNPETVWLTHGYTASVARYLVEQGRDARVLDLRGRNSGDEDVSEDITDDDNDSPSGEAKPS